MLQAQLNSEKRTLQELKQVYQQALKDCEKKIRELSARTDMENLQTIIYQKRYQEALKGQLEGVMATLQSNSYATVSDYLARCYQDGYIGVMYDIHGQGVPIIMPMDQKAIVKAIQTDSKISKGLYSRLGEDVQSLKTSIRAELSRGISNGSSWNEVAGKLGKSFKSTAFSKAYNNSMRIVRTEGHRVQVQSARDAQQAAKDKGADVLKQWDATLDGDTRPTHRQLDGQIRELDEPFEADGKQADAPGMFGDPAEDCNCRCAVLQRARWVLDEAELDTMKERAEYFDLDKTTDFADFKKKYLNACSKSIEKANGMEYTVRTQEELEAVARNIKNDLPNYADLPSKWSGHIKVVDYFEDVGTLAEKDWTCDINALATVDDGTILHELLHSCSCSHYDSMIYCENQVIEEASVEFLKQSICENKKIQDTKGYSDEVMILRLLNTQFSYGSDLEFAKELFNVTLPDRYQWLEDKVEESLRDCNASFSDFNEVLRFLQRLKGTFDDT